MAERIGEAVGQQFGDYRLIRFLGRGSFSDVYLGEHITKRSWAAVKLLRVQLTNIDDVIEFIKEARTFRFVHPNIIQLLDFDIEKNGTPFLVMAYAPNGTLRSHHRRGVRLPLATVVGYVKQIAAALQYAHDERVVHRDVKPENILLGPNNEILLSDFGISSMAHSTRSLNTQDNAGTIPYMAPEQIQGKPRPASDQYALGIMIYEWLCGERPFKGTPMEIISQHAHTDPPPLSKKVPELSSEVEQVVMKALAKDPHERFASVQAFSNALEEASQPKPPLGTTLFIYSSHSDEIRTVAWSPDGLRIASGSADKTVQVWVLSWKDALIDSVETIVNYRGHIKSVNALVWSPDGQRIASVSLDGTAQVWDAGIGNFVLSYTKHTHWVSAVAWSPDGKYIASSSWDETVQVWDAGTGEHIYTYRGHIDGVRTLTWSPDGTRIVSGSADKTVRVWNISTRETIVTYHGHAKGVHAVAWSPDGRSVASGSRDGTVQVWDASTGKTSLIYHGHSADVNAVAWSPDGRRIASGAKDNIVQIWDATTGNKIYTYSDHTNWLVAVSWSSDSKYIASGSVDKTVRVWRAV